MEPKLPNIWEICTFSDEITYGIFDMSRFAVELHDVLSNNKSVANIYRDPVLFFSNTYLTKPMERLLKDVLLRIARNEGSPVYIIDTEFGGGKTHTLLLLYHLFNNRDIGNKQIREYKIDEKYGILEVPEARVVAIDCNIVKRNTLWGEIAYAIGKYDLFKRLDENKEVPKDITLLKSLFDKPTLLLIDELPQYLLKADSDRVGNVTLADLTIAFIQDLIRSVSSVDKCVLIITLTARQKLYESYTERVRSIVDKGNKSITDFRVENIVDDLKQSLSRQSQYIVPVSKEEVYDVIVKRLVKVRKDDYKKVVEAYYNYYLNHGLVSEPNYKDKMLKAYPFHPFLIDTLYERVASIDKFNKTRGMLRLLALAIHEIYKNKRECKIVSTGDIDLSEQLIKESLTDHIDKGDLKQAVESDCISKARRLDSSKNTKLVEKVARTIFIHSLISATKVSGIKPSEVKLAVCYPNIDPSLVDIILQEIDKEFWYLKVENEQYYFSTKPNINKVIYEYMSNVREDEIKDKIRSLFEPKHKSLFEPSIRNNIFKIYVWEKDLPDDEHLKLSIIDYDEIRQDDDSNKRLFANMISNAGNNIRIYQNTIVILYPDYHGIEALKNAARHVIAALKAKDDERIRMDSNDIKAIKQRIEEFEGVLLTTCRNTYSKIAYPYSSDIRIDALPPIYASKYDLLSAIKERLKSSGKLVESLSEEVIANKLERGDKGVMHIHDDIYKVFLKDRRERFVVPASKILDAIKEGVSNSLFGYADRLEEVDGKYKAIIGREVNVRWDGYVIKKDLIYVEDKGKDKEKKEEIGIRVSAVGLGAGVGEVMGQQSTISYPYQDTLSKQYVHRYIIRSNSIDEIIKLLSSVNIVTIGRDHSRSLHARLVNPNKDTIEIRSRLSNIEELKSLLKQLSNLKFNVDNNDGGMASIEIQTYEDISKELKDHGIRYEGA
jgi:hypothetical protein